MAKSLYNEIDDIVGDIDEIDPTDSDARERLNELRDKLNDLKHRAKKLENEKDKIEEDASGHEGRANELIEEMGLLQERYEFAIRMLELGYGVSEHDLSLVSRHTPEDAFRKLTKVARQAIARGDVDAHGGCAYAGGCLAYMTGLASTPCGAGIKSAHKGRFGIRAASSRHAGSALHASCSKGNCFPASLGWIPQAEACQ